MNVHQRVLPRCTAVSLEACVRRAALEILVITLTRPERRRRCGVPWFPSISWELQWPTTSVR